MPKFKSLVDQRFGRLTVIARAANAGTAARWLCQCECGTRKVIYRSALATGKSQSCGCLHREELRTLRTTHGESQGRTPEYRAWQHMKLRCHTPSATGFKYYGGRGITVCARWLESYQNFLDDMGRKPTTTHSIDRINNNGNYEPTNCRWATKREQILNRRPPTR